MPGFSFPSQNISGTLCYMQSSRDSSVWRSLAVAFGDGLAFGVGVKLSHTATALAGGPAAQETGHPIPLAGRMAEIERRLAEIETAPVPAPFDQKVLEAVVHALDGRLKEQSAQVERRLAELETMFTAELKALRQQDHAIATAVEAHIEELQDHFIEQVEAVRRQAAQDRADMQQEVASAVKAASAGAIEESLAPMRAAAAGKDREIAELRQRLEDSDGAMLDLLNGIGELLRHAAARKSPPAAAVAEMPVPKPEPPAVTEQKALPAEVGSVPVPAFAQAARPGRLWRVPLVSSVVAVTFGLVMMHYF